MPLGVGTDLTDFESGSSIHSYNGNVANLTIEELAHHELGETEQVRKPYKWSTFAPSSNYKGYHISAFS